MYIGVFVSILDLPAASYSRFYYLDFSFIISVDVLVGVNSSLFARKCFPGVFSPFSPFSSYLTIPHLLSLLSLFFPYWRKMCRHFGISFVVSLLFPSFLLTFCNLFLTFASFFFVIFSFRLSWLDVSFSF